MSSSQVIQLRINLTDKEAYVLSQTGELFYPNAFAYAENGRYNIKNYDNNEIGYAIALMPDNRTILLMSEELTGSIFTRLFYFDGIGLSHFKKVYDTRDITGSRIITWKIEWPDEE